MTLRRWLPSFTLTVMSGTTLFAQGVNGPIVTIRTAGQPDRKVMILKVERLPDGMVLSDVRDLATGLVYSITDTKPPSGMEGESIPVPAPAAPSRAYPALPTPPAVAPPGNTMSLLPAMPPVNPSNGAPQAAQAQLPASTYATPFPTTTRPNQAPQGQQVQMGQPGQVAQFGQQPQMGQGAQQSRAPSAFASPYPTTTQPNPPTQTGFAQQIASQGQQPQQPQRTAFASSYLSANGTRQLPIPNAPANSDAQLPSARNRQNDPLLVNGMQRLSNNTASKPTTPAPEKAPSLWDRMFGAKQETVANTPAAPQNHGGQNGPAITPNAVPRNNSTVTPASYMTSNPGNRGTPGQSSDRQPVTPPVSLASKPASTPGSEPKLPEPKPVEGSLTKIETAQAETHADTLHPVITPTLPETRAVTEPTLVPMETKLPSPISVPQMPGSTLAGSMPVIPEARLVQEPAQDKANLPVPTTAIATPSIPTTPIPTPTAPKTTVSQIAAPVKSASAPTISTPTISTPAISTPSVHTPEVGMAVTTAVLTAPTAALNGDTGKTSGGIKMPTNVIQQEPVPVQGSNPATAGQQSTSAKVANSDLSPEEQMKRDLSESVHELLNHIRPSYRMEMATTIADSRYGWREEVKQLLHRVAITDPAPIVRGHCINLLSKLGYEDPAYVGLLQKWSTDSEPAVRLAATTAMSKLKSR